MLWIVLLLATCSEGADLEADGTVKRYVYRDRDAEPRQADLGPVEINYPVKMVQKYTDSDGNVQVVTSYSNRKDSPLPIYHSAPIPENYRQEERSAGYVPVVPRERTSQIEVEERSVPKKQQISRTQTIRFPDARGEMVDHEEKTSFRDGNSKSFRTESSYDNSYRKPNLRRRVNSAPREDTSRSYIKPIVVKDVNVPLQSVANAVRRAPVPSGFRSAQSSLEAEDDREPIRASKKADHALEPAGSTYVSDIEEIESDEDGGLYDDSLGYEEHDGGIGLPIGGGYGPVHGALVEEHGPVALVEGPVPIHGGLVEGHGHGYGGHGGHGIDHKYAKEGGQAYKHGEHFSKGEKAGKGHQTKESYDKGHSEKHGHEHNKGGKKEEVGEKKGHIDEHNSYHKGHSYHQGEKGADKAHSKGHKKGHKTKGFRTVHHKDEYKKDEVFYDEEHDAGHEKHHGKEHGGHKEAKGGESKKGHLDSGYKDAVKGVEGEKKEGHSYEHSKGHAASSGHKGHEGHKEGYHKGEGHKGQEAHGHHHESKGKGW